MHHLYSLVTMTTCNNGNCPSWPSPCNSSSPSSTPPSAPSFSRSRQGVRGNLYVPGQSRCPHEVIDRSLLGLHIFDLTPLGLLDFLRLVELVRRDRLVRCGGAAHVTHFIDQGTDDADGHHEGRASDLVLVMLGGMMDFCLAKSRLIAQCPVGG